MEVIVLNRALAGSIAAPPSKAQTHRALICQKLAGGGRLVNPLVSGDTRTTRLCLDSIKSGGEVKGVDSASALRLVLPTALLFGTASFEFVPGFTAPEDVLNLKLPVEPYEHGLRATWRLEQGMYRIGAEHSVQLACGMLMALPACGGDSILHFAPDIFPAYQPYIRLTLELQRRFGVWVNEVKNGYYIPGKQRYHVADLMLEGDWDYCACFATANAMGAKVELGGLNPSSIQPGRRIEELLQQSEPDAACCPGLVPLLAAAACAKQGQTTVLTGGALPQGELCAIAAQLAALGADIAAVEGGIRVCGTGTLAGGVADACGSPRLAMALAVAACICKTPVAICGAECVARSYPRFFDDIRKLGGM